MIIYGPYTRKDGRKHVVKYSEGKRTTQSYPRYLMEMHLGRPLSDEETVDHIDNDYTNDDIDNLQLLTRTDNAKKEMSRQHRKEKLGEYVCPQCSGIFIRRVSAVVADRKKGKSGPFCSRHCAGVWSTS